MSENVRLGFAVLAASWFFPVFAWIALKVMSDNRANAAWPVALVYRTIPAVILWAAVVAASWPLAISAFSTALVGAAVVEILNRRLPEDGDRLGEPESEAPNR